MLVLFCIFCSVDTGTFYLLFLRNIASDLDFIYCGSDFYVTVKFYIEGYCPLLNIIL